MLKNRRENPHLLKLWGRDVIREEVHGTSNDVRSGTSALKVLWLLSFTKDLDGGESSNLPIKRAEKTPVMNPMTCGEKMAHKKRHKRHSTIMS